MVDTHDGETQTAVKHVRGGFDGLTSWLTGMFDRDGWRPAGVVVVGADNDINGFSWQLEKTLAGTGFRANHGAGDDRARRGAGGGAKHRVHRRAAGGRRPVSPPPRPRPAAAVLLRRGGDRLGRRCGHLRLVALARRGHSAGSGQRVRNGEARGAHVDATGRRGRRAGRRRHRAPGGGATHAAGAAARRAGHRSQARGARCRPDRTTEPRGCSSTYPATTAMSGPTSQP